MDFVPKLRIGLLLDSWQVKAWELAMLARIVDSAYARIEVVGLNATPVHRPRFMQRLLRNRHGLFYSFYQRLDRRLFSVSRDAFAICDASEVLRGVPTVRIVPQQTRHSDVVRTEDLAALREYELDVMLRLGFRILKGEILSVAKYGVWSYHHGDNRVNRGGPAGFWEVVKGHAVTGAVLQQLSEELDNGRVLAKTFSATDPVSVTRNRNGLYWKSLSMVPRQLQKLQSEGPDRFFRAVEENRARLTFYDRPLYRAPRNRQMLRPFARLAWRTAGQYVQRAVFREEWLLLYHFDPHHVGPATALWKFKWLRSPRDGFWADPHVVRRDGKYYVFLEEYLWRTGKGHISVLELGPSGPVGPPHPIISRPYHLAYPFVFSWQGQDYLIPDSFSNRTIELYKCDGFPHRWSFHKTLMKGVDAVDTTLLLHEGRWWMFTNLMENEGGSSWDELFLFHADTPLSDTWTPHPLNPVVSDTRRARPAGAIFAYDGSLYRPSQDCSHGYGYGVRLNRILRLDTSGYEESGVDEIEPRWAPGLSGVHTLSFADNLTLIDAKRHRLRW